MIAGVRVASPERTLVDLARSADADDLAAARAWGASDPALAASARAWLSRHPRFPYGRRADEVLATTALR